MAGTRPRDAGRLARLRAAGRRFEGLERLERAFVLNIA
jgi:hypothetical protein